MGGVITDPINDNSDTSFFGRNYLETTRVEGVFEALNKLVFHFDGDVYVVSKCGPRTEQRSREWFDHHKFYEQTGIAREHVHFCRERADKAPICEQLDITHFIDDKLEVLGYLTTVPNKFLFRGRPQEIARHTHLLPQVKQVQSWEEVLRALIK
jgi:hypothetical protein